MRFKLRLVPAAVAAALLVACGGGGDSSSGSGGSATATSGRVIDGYVSFAKVVCDANENGVADTGEAVAYTDTAGKFVFAGGCTNSYIATGGISADTNLAFVGVARAPAKSTIVSPLTTLLSSGMTQAQINTALGLSASTDVTTLDTAAVNSDGSLVNPTLYKKSLVVQQLLQKTSEMLTSLGGSAGSSTTNAIYTIAANTVATSLKSGGSLFLSDTAVDPAAVAAVVSAVTTAVGTSSAVDSSVKTKVAAASATAVATVTSPAYVDQSNKILGSGTTSTSVAAVTTTQQSSTFVADFMGQNSNIVATSTATSAAVLSSLGQTVASSSASGVNTLDTVLATFDESTALTAGGFGGNQVFAGIVTLPSTVAAGSSSGKVLQVTRTDAAAVGTTYDGGYTTLATVVNGATSQTISAVVYSPVAGVPIKLSIEAKASGSKPADKTGDVASNETVVKGWQTLTWSFTGLKDTADYSIAAVTPRNGTVSPTGGETFYFDTFKLLSKATPIVATNYLTLTDDKMTLVNGSKTTNFTLADFQSAAGISTSWPLSSSAQMTFKLTEVGNFTLAAGQKLNAAIEVTETGTGQGLVQGYIKDVAVTKTGSSITITVPASTSGALTYGVTSDAKKKAIVSFVSDVAGVTSTLTSDSTGYNALNIGDVLQHTITSMSNQFTGISALRGKYKVKIVISDLPLRQANGVVFNAMTIQVPTELNSDGTTKTTTPVSGVGIMGYITLTD